MSLLGGCRAHPRCWERRSGQCPPHSLHEGAWCGDRGPPPESGQDVRGPGGPGGRGQGSTRFQKTHGPGSTSTTRTPEIPESGEHRAGPGGTRPWARRSVTLSPSVPADLNVSPDTPDQIQPTWNTSPRSLLTDVHHGRVQDPTAGTTQMPVSQRTHTVGPSHADPSLSCRQE